MDSHQTKIIDRNTKKKKQMEAQNYQKTQDKMTIGNPHTSIITLNVYKLNSPIKRLK